MMQYMLDTSICIHVIRSYPPEPQERFNRLAEQLCISSVTLGELHYGAEESARRLDNLQAIEHFTARPEALPFTEQPPRTTVRLGPSSSGSVGPRVLTT